MLPSDFIDFANALADAAGAAIRPYFRAPLTVEIKSDLSPVTQADRAAEQAMRALIARHHPTHGIHGEEYGLERPDAPYRWVLDPIDGTRAFMTGRPLFGTLIALLHHDTPILGIIDQPISAERWLGVTGHPTQFRGPHGTPRTRPCATLSEAELSATSPEMMANHLPCFQNLARATRRTTWGGDCYAYGLLALGQIDIIAERDLKIWDWAALLPIVEGAGGRMTDWSGRPLTPESDGSALAVGDPSLLQEAIKKLEGR
jgi:histidinol phosphatase-like enzyme (inositol monophosphatase family)